MEKLKEVLYSRLQTMTTEQYEKYLKEAEGKYINIKSHPEDENIVILNYSEVTTFERRWNKETMSARGLILDITNANNNGLIYILAKPFEKFFNYGENLDYEGDIDFSQQPVVMEKMDGSLGISYFINNEIRFATRGSFISDQAIKATEIWREKYQEKYKKLAYVAYPYTIMVEIIYPENRIVVDYKGKEDLVLLGIRNITKDENSLDESSYNVLQIVSNWWDMPLAPQFDFTIDKLLEKKKSITANEEGWILKFPCNKRLKIKGDEYLQVHRIVYGLSEKAKFNAFAEGTLEDLIFQMPEEFREELEKFKENLELIKEDLIFELNSYYKPLELITDRKEFALKVNELVPKEMKRFMFHARNHNNGAISEEQVRKYIYNNYIDYIEVIKKWNKSKE